MEIPAASAVPSVPQDLRSECLERTICHALRASLYRERFGSAKPRDLCRDFANIPPITKADLVAAGDSSRAPCDEWRQYYTGGTTGVAFPYQVSLAEQAFLTDFFTAFFDDTPRRRAARLWDGGQVFGRSIPVPLRFHDVSIYTPGACMHLAAILGGRYDEPYVPPRCDLLVGGERVLRAFACWAMANGPQPGWPMVTILTFGTSLTRGTRDLFTRSFGGPVIDRYGLSEAVGGATECSCGWYHPDPCLIVEALALDNLEPVEEGVARLVITPLYPFQQRQPLIRYDTGDLAEATLRQSCRVGELAIRPLGRRSNALFARGTLMLSETDLLEAVEDFTEIARLPTLRDCAELDPKWPIGRLQCEAKPTADGQPAVTVTLRAKVSTQRAKTLRSTIVDRITAAAEAKTGSSMRLRITLRYQS